MFQNGKNSQFTACMLLVFALVQHLSYETVVQNVTRRIGKLEIMVNFYARCCAIFLAENILNEALFVWLQKLLPGETLCKISYIFPPKVLVYRGDIFC